MCARDRECLFGNVVGGETRLNEYGRLVDAWWQDVPSHFPQADLDAHVIMPNHLHGIVVIGGMDAGDAMDAIKTMDVGARFPCPGSRLGNADGGAGTAPLRVKRPTLGQIVAYFKYQSTTVVSGSFAVSGPQGQW